jgi:ATP-binding cassette subfamily F protein 3
MELRKLERLAELKTSATVKEEVKKPKPIENTDNQEKEKQQKQLKNKITKLEQEIESMETKITELDKKLSDPVFYEEAVKKNNFFNDYNQLKKDLETKMSDWERCCEELKSL